MSLLQDVSFQMFYFERWSVGLNGTFAPNLYTAYSGTTNHTQNTEGVVNNDSWYHIVGVYAEDSDRIYVNGLLVANVPNIYPDMTCDNFQKIYVGCAGNTIGKKFKGAIDDIRVFDRVLTQEEIIALNAPIEEEEEVAVNKVNADFIKLFPNPTEGTVTLNFKSELTNVTITVTDLNGRVVAEKNMNNSVQTTLTLEETAGVYFVNVIADQGSYSSRIIKK